MDLVMYGLAFVMGGLAFRLVFGGMRPGPFEQSLMANLALGKKVIVSIDEECYIFEMYGNRLRISKGVSTFTEEPYVVESDNLVNLHSNKSGDDNNLSG